jgi:hypothetical protein
MRELQLNALSASAAPSEAKWAVWVLSVLFHGGLTLLAAFARAPALPPDRWEEHQLVVELLGAPSDRQVEEQVAGAKAAPAPVAPQPAALKTVPKAASNTTPSPSGPPRPPPASPPVVNVQEKSG